MGFLLLAILGVMALNNRTGKKLICFDILLSRLSILKSSEFSISLVLFVLPMYVRLLSCNFSIDIPLHSFSVS